MNIQFGYVDYYVAFASLALLFFGCVWNTRNMVNVAIKMILIVGSAVGGFLLAARGLGQI